jgi:hypothetical protein
MSASQDFPRQAAHNGDGRDLSDQSYYLPAQGEPRIRSTTAATSETTPPNTADDDPYFLPLSFEDTFEQVLRVFRERYLAFMAITFLIYAAGWVFAVIAAYTLGADLQIDGFSVSVAVLNMDSAQQGYYDENGDFYFEESPQTQAWQCFLYILECSIYYCFICIARGASVWLAAHLYLHQRPTMMDAFRRAAKSAWPLIGSLLLTGCLCVIPLIFVMLVVVYTIESMPQLMVLAVLGFLAYASWLHILFYHTYPAIMVEKLGPVVAMTRSYHLTEDHRCYILGVLLCWWLVRVVIGMVIASIHISGEVNSWVWYLGSALDVGCGILFAAVESV